MIREGVDDGDQPLEGLKILVDAGNGCGGFFVDKVLKPLGAITTGSQVRQVMGADCSLFFASCHMAYLSTNVKNQRIKVVLYNNAVLMTRGAATTTHAP